MKQYSEVPSWANSMIRNWRLAGKISSSVSDLQLFNVIEGEQLHLLEEEDALELLREKFPPEDVE